ncbi:MAG TPA: SDR family oxidoreductase [Solirubrobacterales bacterium]|nr:SDR family oxidoreductase [Solirubrobacterales bacterium]
MDLGIAGRVALVMAASKGIGRGVAEALAREGARVAIASRSRERVEEAAAQIDGEVLGFAADTGDLERMAELPREVAEAVGPVEILVTNTGGPSPGEALAADLGDWREAYEHLVLAPRVLVEAVLPGMRERGWGRIVNVGSSATREPIPGLALSNSHRPGLVGFLKTLSREVAADGVTVNDIATGRFATDRLASNWGGRERMEQLAAEGIPAGRLGQPSEYGDLVAFLCSERAAYITGTSIPIDGGMLRSV